MPNKIVLIAIIVVIVCVMLLGNKKVRVVPVLIKQLQIFKNANTNKISVWDIVCFIILPIVLAVLITVGLRYEIDDNLAEVLTTVFAFVFTVLFGFAAILVGKLDSNNKIEKQVVGETFVSIMTSNILSLVSAALSIAIIITTNEISSLVLCIFSISAFRKSRASPKTLASIIAFGSFTQDEFRTALRACFIRIF